MLHNYDFVRSAGGTCAMISLNSVGLSGVKKICDHGLLAIHGHRNGWGMLNRHPLLGIEFPAYQKLWRLAGVDQIHVNGIANKFWESDDSVVRSIEACLKPMLGGYSILPVVSSGQTGLQAPETLSPHKDHSTSSTWPAAESWPTPAARRRRPRDPAGLGGRGAECATG